MLLLSLLACALLTRGAAAVASLTGGPPPNGTVPWGIHLAYGADPTTSMTVAWSTREPTNSSLLSLTPTNSSARPVVILGSSVEFNMYGNVQYFHRVNLSGLLPGSSYSYSVGDGVTNSDFYTFTTLSDDDSFVPVVSIIGDMGSTMTTTNSVATLQLLLDDVAGQGLQQPISAVLHIGDLAYDLDNNGGQNGDWFMQDIQPVASQVPYHATVGNHENSLDFGQYIGRFNIMPPSAAQTGDSMYHSINIGKAHFVFVSSEAYFYPTAHGWGLLEQQYNWLVNDLSQVNRTETPWIVLMLHRP